MPSAPPVVRGFSPLDEELGLLPGSLTPTLVESTVRLGTWMPFGPAMKMLAYFTKVEVSEPTVRRVNEKAGQAYVEVQTAQVEALERELPEAKVEAEVQQMSVDGAYVRLVGKAEWAEVKTLAIGTVSEPVLNREGEWEVHTQELSYFSRMAEHETFGRLATVETQRRGIEKAKVVCGVVDGAEWEQKFFDLHRPDAVRILDFRHAAEYLVKAGQAALGVGTEATSEWIRVQLHELKHGDPEEVLEGLRGLQQGLVADGEEGQVGSEALKVVTGSLGYLEKRKEQIRYREFQGQGYPIGSGAVESANKLVVEARLKGSGMHWAREHVDPMVALRTIACSDRWEEAWPQIVERLCQQRKEGAQQRRAEGRKAEVLRAGANLATLVDEEQVVSTATEVAAPEVKTLPEQAGCKPTSGGRRPAADHPWRRMPIGRARGLQAHCLMGAET